jgi:hypothetical protein
MERKIKKAKIAAKLLDSQFDFYGIRFGFDPIIDIIPWFGDVAGLILSLYILNIAKDVGVSKSDMLKMIFNVLLDFIIGIIPYLGAVFDIFFRANIKNLKILEKYSHGKFVEGTIIS